MAGKPPAFQFYPKDFLTDAKCARLSDEEAGIYIRMMSMYWIENRTLPSDLRILAEMLPRTTYARLKKAWVRLSACWEVDGDVLRQPMLDRKAVEQERFRAAASEFGKRGAAARREKRRVPLADPQGSGQGEAADTLEGGSSPSSASSSASADIAAAAIGQDTISRATLSPAIQFGMWFLEHAIAAGCVPEHEAIDPFAWAYRQLDASETLLKTYGLEACQARAEALFAAKGAGVVRTRNADVAWLARFWGMAELDRFAKGASDVVSEYLSRNRRAG